LNFTNDVTIDFIANGLLCVGASPVMCKAEQEIEDLVRISNAVVINIGTLDEKHIMLCETACRIANQLGRPIIFDPVGAGASHYRTTISKKIISTYQIAIVRGNASEIMALAGYQTTTRGVDSNDSSIEAIKSAGKIANKFNVVVVISGETDVIIDNNRIEKIIGGSDMMPKITGTGCLMTAIIAAFHAVQADKFTAAALAAYFYGLCGEQAARLIDGVGSFKTKFLDCLSNYDAV